MSFQDFSDLASLAEFHSWRGSSGPVLFSSNHRDNNPLCEPPEHSQKRTCWSKDAVEALVNSTFLKKIKRTSNTYSWIGGKPAECLTRHTAQGGGAFRTAPRLIGNSRLLCSNYSMINKSSTWIIIFITLPSMLLLQPQSNFTFMFWGRRVSKNGTANRKKRGLQGLLTSRRFKQIPLRHFSVAKNTVPTFPFKSNRCWLENEKSKNRRHHLDNWIHAGSSAIACPYQRQHRMA